MSFDPRFQIHGHVNGATTRDFALHDSFLDTSSFLLLEKCSYFGFIGIDVK